MERCAFLALSAALISTFGARAGTLSEGKWSPDHCGTLPPTPEIASSSIDAFNNSVERVNEWQQKAKSHNDCIVDEANADNNLIAKTANTELEQFRVTVEKLKVLTEAGKAKLERNP